VKYLFFFWLHGLKKPLVKMFNIIFSLLLCGQKITWGFTSVQISLFFPHMWIKKSFVSLQVCKYHYIFFTYVNKKNHLRVCKSAISLFFFLCKLKNHWQAQKYPISFFSLPMWIKKIICRPTSVQYHFFLLLCVLKNHLRTHKCAILFIFFSYVNRKNHLQVVQSFKNI